MYLIKIEIIFNSINKKMRVKLLNFYYIILNLYKSFMLIILNKKMLIFINKY